MLEYLLEQFRKNKAFKLVTIFFIGLTIWWVTIFARGLTEGNENNLFTVVYPILSLLGGIAGWVFAKKWGGFKSTLGSSIGMFALGLLAQFVGQVMYSYYIYIKGIEIPYPSVGDISFFSSIIFYLIGVILLSKVSGLKMSVKSMRGKLQAFLIPLGILLISYLVFLKGYAPDWSNKMVIFLDFGYPIGQAVYVSIAILALLISKDILGGMMRKPIMLLVAALILQYIADFNFSYQVSRDAWYVGGFNDYLYCAAYFFMTISLFSIGNMFYKVQES